jgi:hypothetical protein
VKKTLIIIVILVSVIVIMIFLRVKNRGIREYIKIDESVYQFGRIKVDKLKNTIEFTGKVAKMSGYVDFLLYVYGYKWLEKSCAVISDAKLSDLQNAIAFLDWKLWDELWTKGGVSSESQPEMFIRYGSVNNEAAGFINAGGEALEIGDFVFLGSPYFDPVVLRDKSSLDCESCPVYELEEKTLRKEFIRGSGKSGYELNQKTMPPEGEKVIITLRCQSR